MIIGAAALAAVAVAVPVINSRIEKYVHSRLSAALQERYGSDLEYSRFDVRVLPSIHVEIENLVFRHHGRRDVPPVIEIRRFNATAGLLQMIRSPRHVRRIDLDGLVVTVPPRREQKKEDRASAPETKQRSPVVVDEIYCEAAVVRILPKQADKDPLTFDIHRLAMKSVGLDRAAPFSAVLTNAAPPGEISVSGEFGPWQKDDPGSTPLAAKYEFKNADLGHFRGIGGILSSNGKFGGVLERIVVDGETHTPDFVVDAGGHPVSLDTVFHAIVDGTSGDTLLQPVRARLANSTTIIAKGGVVKSPGARGRTVKLDVTVPEGRLQDVLLLAVKSDKPPIVGGVSFTTKFELPPGEARIAERLRLDGQFGINSATFTSLDIQQKVDTLSRKGRGEPEEDPSTDRVVSGLAGRFRLAAGIIRFSALQFTVPGASVQLNGTYGLLDEALDFRGNLRLAAKPSETTTGVKSFFLKLVDPFLSKQGVGTVLPIRVSGNREKPEFGVALGGGK